MGGKEKGRGGRLVRRMTLGEVGDVGGCVLGKWGGRVGFYGVLCW